MKTLPEDFIQYTQELMGDELFLQLKQGITEGEAPTSIRLNPFKCKEGEDAAGEPIPWCPSTGRYLSTRPNFTFDPWLHAGKYYVQEASSMFVDLVIRQLVHEPVMMLDLCAAPGGKSTASNARREKMLRANRFHGALPPVAISPPVLTSPSIHGSMPESITCRRLLPCSWIW